MSAARPRKWLWEVWPDHGGVRYFETLRAAEIFAHNYVARADKQGFSPHAEICHNFHKVAEVRMDGAGRVWTDVTDSTLA